MEEPIFVIGAQRSGTTLMRLMLNSHSQIAIPEEGTFWMPLLRKYKGRFEERITDSELERALKYIKSNTQFKLWRIETEKVFGEIRKGGGCCLGDLITKLYEHYARSFDKRIWGDKTPSFFRMISVLKELFPYARFIHVIRDGRDVFLSCRKMNPSKSNVCVAALEWVYKVKKAQEQLRSVNPERVLEIRYEDLVAKTETGLSKTCLFLGVGYEPEMLNYWHTSQNLIGAHHSELVFHPVAQIPVNRWKREMREDELRSFEWIAGKTLVSLGYRLSQKDSHKMKSGTRAIWHLLHGLPLRAVQVFRTALVLNICARFGLATAASGKGKPPGPS